MLGKSLTLGIMCGQLCLLLSTKNLSKGERQITGFKENSCICCSSWRGCHGQRDVAPAERNTETLRTRSLPAEVFETGRPIPTIGRSGKTTQQEGRVRGPEERRGVHGSAASAEPGVVSDVRNQKRAFWVAEMKEQGPEGGRAQVVKRGGGCEIMK